MGLRNYQTLLKFILLISPVFISYSIQARTIEKITIEQTGLALEDERDKLLASTCKKFNPSLNQIKFYFQKAYPIPGKLMAHDRYTPCYATGNIIYSDGFKAKWVLYSAGTAWLEWLDGGEIYLLYKKNKWLDPTAGMYDDDGQEY
ncbi:hypothetical protein HZU77_008880 [Neisseriaceae bacterium TC5R-5]|nr:hypothetical protein [Neisseriaceae bacterium TC5R-5]